VSSSSPGSSVPAGSSSRCRRRLAQLANEDDPVAIVDRDDGDRAGMLDDLALVPASALARHAPSS
jgi:hypothetical protein